MDQYPVGNNRRATHRFPPASPFCLIRPRLRHSRFTPPSFREFGKTPDVIHKSLDELRIKGKGSGEPLWSIFLFPVKTTPVSFSYSALLRIEDAPNFHEELTRRLGTPDTCIDEPTGQRGALWVIESPASENADINDHIAWAASLVERHSDFLCHLVSSGVRATLHIACDTSLDYVLIGFDSLLFRPFVDTGIAIEFYAGMDAKVAIE